MVGELERDGDTESVAAFFDWCAGVLLARADRVRAGVHPHARYTASGEESEAEWPTFQLDGFGLLLWALTGHCARHGVAPATAWRDAATLVADYLERIWHLPRTDWWEERQGLHATTLGCVIAGLEAWERPAGALRGALGKTADWRVDASLLTLETPLGVVARERALLQVEASLVSLGGGVRAVGRALGRACLPAALVARVRARPRARPAGGLS